MAFADLDALGESAQMIPSITAPILPEPLTGRGRELAERRWRHGHLAGTFELGLRPLRIDLRLVAQRPERDDTLLQRRVVEIGDA